MYQRLDTNPNFQSNIQENKDWNLVLCFDPWFTPLFQSNIQENKDWNLLRLIHRLNRESLSEQHPREQGLKLRPEQHRPMVAPDSFRATSKRTRIETHRGYPTRTSGEAFQSNIQENKDWNSMG